jgi:GNAT superfamily N-acetyltransferase
MGKLTLAPMEPWDTVALLPLLEQMAADEARMYPRQDPEDLAKVQGWLLDRLGSPGFGAFVMRDGFKAKGLIWGTLEHRPFVQPRDYLEARLLYVAASHRKRGIARKLAAALTGWARERLGPDAAIEIMALPDMAAYPMWKAAGFRTIGIRMAWIDEQGQVRPGIPLAPPRASRDTPERMEAHG